MLLLNLKKDFPPCLLSIGSVRALASIPRDNKIFYGA